MKLPVATLDAVNEDARRMRGQITMAPHITRDGIVKRDCGTCDECCHALSVEASPVICSDLQTHEFNKPGGTRCEHGKNACRIYEHRPLSCRGYACLWVMGWGREEDRPDRCGVIVDCYIDAAPGLLLQELFGSTPVCFVTEIRPGVFPPKGDREAGAKTFPSCHQFPEPVLGLSHERAVLVRWYGDGHPELVIGPDEPVWRFQVADAEYGRRGM